MYLARWEEGTKKHSHERGWQPILCYREVARGNENPKPEKPQQVSDQAEQTFDDGFELGLHGLKTALKTGLNTGIETGLESGLTRRARCQHINL